MDVAALDAAAGQPRAEAVGVVVAADVLLVLDDRQAAHLAAPVDDGRVEQPALLEVADQGRRGPIDLAAHRGQLLDDPAVVVPVLVAGADLDEPHAALDQPAGDQAAGAELAGRRVVEAVERQGRGRLAREVERFLRGRLHPRGQLVAGDPRRQVVLAGVLVEMVAVELDRGSRGTAPGPVPGGAAADRGWESAARWAGPRSPGRATAASRSTSCRRPARAARRDRSGHSRPAGSGSRSRARR